MPEGGIEPATSWLLTHDITSTLQKTYVKECIQTDNDKNKNHQTLGYSKLPNYDKLK